MDAIIAATGTACAERASVVKRILVLALLCILSACVHPVSPERASALKTVGVISLTGNNITLQSVGHLALSNESTTEQVPEWGLNQFILDRFNAELSKRYDVRSVTVDKTALQPGQFSLESLGAAVRASASPQGLDAYIVVLGGSSRYGTTNFSVLGVGLLSVPAPFFTGHNYYLHALYRVLVIDGSSGAMIGDGSAPPLPDAGIMPNIRGPYRVVDESWWAPSLAEMSQQQRQQLGDGLKDVIQRSVPDTLRTLKLAD